MPSPETTAYPSIAAPCMRVHRSTALLHKPFGQPEGSSTLLPPGVAQERGIDIRYGEAEKRAMLKGSIGMLVAPVVISSAIKAPTPGPSWKPWAEKPNW